MKKLFCFVAVAASLSLWASDRENESQIIYEDDLQMMQSNQNATSSSLYPTNDQYQQPFYYAPLNEDLPVSNAGNIQMDYNNAPAQDGCLKRWAFKTVECAFCENPEDSDEPSCSTDGCILVGGISCFLGALSKLFVIGLTSDPKGYNWAENFACSYSWFPSCSRQFMCGNDPSQGMDACWAPTMAWSSSLCLMGSCALTTCLLLKKYRDTSKNNALQNS
jgi:hypothetical protein